MKRKRRNHSASFKAKVALGALKEEKESEIKDLHAKTGELPMERDFLSAGLGQSEAI